MALAWERLENESPRAFAYFEAYRRLPRPRRIADLCVQFRRCARTFELSARKHAWYSRCEQYDRHVAEQDETRFAELRIEAEKVRLQRELLRREQCWAIAERLLRRVVHMLEDEAVLKRWDYRDVVRLSVAFERLTRAACQPFAEEAVRREPRRVAGTFTFDDSAPIALDKPDELGTEPAHPSGAVVQHSEGIECAA